VVVDDTIVCGNLEAYSCAFPVLHRVCARRFRLVVQFVSLQRLRNDRDDHEKAGIAVWHRIEQCVGYGVFLCSEVESHFIALSEQVGMNGHNLSRSCNPD
jgi:hypothetical protein